MKEIEERERGFDVQMETFHIGRNLPPQERIVLFVVQLDNLETSSCIISPPNVSILVNGKDVKKMCSTSQDNGPQFPSDIIKVLKYGTNIIQAVGYYDNSELIEGPSRITLNCPIRTKTTKSSSRIGDLQQQHPAVQQAQQQNFWMNQPTAILPQSSMQAQQASQARSGLNRRKQPSGANSAPPDAKRFRLAASNPSQRTPDDIRMFGSDSLQATSATEKQQNWRATGRMRGSLSGSAYEAALNQYLVPSAQPASTASTVATALDPILQFATGTEQEGFKTDDGGRRPEQ